MDSFTRYASRPTAATRSTARNWLAALVVTGLFFLAHLDLIIWGA